MSTDDELEFQVVTCACAVPDDPPAMLRDNLRGIIDDEATLTGTVRHRFQFRIGDSFETIMTGGVSESARELLLTGAFIHLGARPDVRRRFRLGERDLVSDGTRHRVVALLEHVVDDGTVRWWVSWRLLCRGDLGIGILRGGWQEQEGVGVDGLDPSLRAWLDPSATAVRARLTTPPAVSSDTSMRRYTLREPRPTPTDAPALAELVGRLTDREIVTRYLPRLLVFTLSGRRIERWDLGARLPCTLDDFVRGLARNAHATGVAVVHPVTTTDEGRGARGWAVSAEMAGSRVDRLVFVVVGGTGDLELRGPVLQDREPCWLDAQVGHGRATLDD